MNNTDTWDVVVIGSGPGGYAAAFKRQIWEKSFVD